MILKERRIEGKQMRIQEFLDPWQIGLGVFGVRMVALNRKGKGGEEQKDDELFAFQRGSSGNKRMDADEAFSGPPRCSSVLAARRYPLRSSTAR